jgi:superfamily I DNA/RNA helicase
MSLNDSLKTQKSQASHLIVIARAGTGKTTTLVEGLKRVKGLETTITPSPQQAAVWKAMEQSKDARSICFVAFNKSIATELSQRVPEGCDAMTMHSMGFRAIRKRFDNVKVNQYRVRDIIGELLGMESWELRKKKPEVLQATEKLVGLCKMNLTDPNIGKEEVTTIGICWSQALAELSSYYDVDLNGHSTEVFTLVPRVLDRCKDVDRDGCIDFNDMIWLPVVLDLTLWRYDLLLVDEAQDLNRCQQELACKAGSRLILCGDPKQAIYGFAGADSESMSRMQQRLEDTEQGCEVLPLTVTYRCGKAIVAEAQKYVSDFEAHESNHDGTVCNLDFDDGYREEAEYGDMLLCRVNAPLVSECFRFLRQGRRAEIQGRDIGQGLISTVKKQKASSVPELQERLSLWLYNECEREHRNRNPSENRLIALQDRYDCLACFMEGMQTVDQVITRIEEVFTDDKESVGIKLSSVHKAKGLESRRVFILQPEKAGMPHPMAKTPWQQEQELNLLYVAITRAIEELVWVS